MLLSYLDVVQIRRLVCGLLTALSLTVTGMMKVTKNFVSYVFIDEIVLRRV